MELLEDKVISIRTERNESRLESGFELRSEAELLKKHVSKPTVERRTMSSEKKTEKAERKRSNTPKRSEPRVVKQDRSNSIDKNQRSDQKKDKKTFNSRLDVLEKM